MLSRIFHFIATALLALALLPACRYAGLRLTLGPEHVVWFVLLGAFCFPLAALLGAFDRVQETLASLRTNRLRLVFAAIVGLLLFLLNEIQIGIVLALNAIVLLEFLYRNPKQRSEKLLAIIVPAGYFLVGFTLVMLWNDVIVTFRYYSAWDHFFASLDQMLMAGYSVPHFSAWVGRTPALLTAAEFIYFFMFNVMGAVLILLALDAGIKRAFHAVGVILLAYYISLFCFTLMPCKGPYLGHENILPPTLASTHIQRNLIERAEMLWMHSGVLPARGSYNIGFPCMHIVQPLIAIHYMRHRRRLRKILCAYLLVLVVAIFALNWHYLTDLIGGLFVAYLVLKLAPDTD